MADLRLCRHLVLRCTRRQHPSRDVQTPPGAISDRERDFPVTRPADHVKIKPVKGMEWVIDGDSRTYGIVTVVASRGGVNGCAGP
jgi:hypothetical protein